MSAGFHHRMPLKQWTRHMVAVRIRAAVAYADGSQAYAAIILGTDRSTINRYLKWDEKYGHQRTDGGITALDQISAQHIDPSKRTTLKLDLD